MKVRCEYCDSYLEDTQEVCPNCGAGNPQYRRSAEEAPRTIAQLQQWYTDHNLPQPNVTRFFIGQDYRGAKAFGIYREGDRFVVYKNKSNGSRAVRYNGTDEAYAVNEIYLKLKERIAEQKAANRAGTIPPKKKSSNLWDILIVLAIIFCALGPISLRIANRIANRYDQGYYSYQGQQYYCLNDDWYWYQPDSGWSAIDIASEFAENAADYYLSSDFSYDYGTTDFSQTPYYADWEASNIWDSDSFWDSGDSWDSGGGDWDSDW